MELLRAKTYALRLMGESDMKGIKGAKRNIVAKTITLEDFEQRLNESSQQEIQACVRLMLHKVYTVSKLKVALCPYDDMRNTQFHRYVGSIYTICNLRSY
ncbi:hypothetical protein P5V15_010141 [Pogonomyrmex californicus]